MARRDRYIEEDEARELWRRAAELQSQAERDRSRSQSVVPIRGDGVSIEQVSDVAEDAGIDPEYVRLAYAERNLADAESISPDTWTSRWVQRLVNKKEAVEASQIIEAPPQRVLESFHSIASKPAFEMDLEDSIGDDPIVDGVLVFRVNGSSQFHTEMYLADARVVLVTIRPEGEHTRLRLRVPIYERGLNLAFTGILSGVLGSTGAAGGVSGGTALAGLIGGASFAFVAVPAVLGAAAGGAAGIAAWRGVARWSNRKGDYALRRLIKAVIMEAESRKLGQPE